MKFRLALLLAVLLPAATLPGTSLAQRTTGNIGGEANAGDTVVVNGPATGFHREITIEQDGKYSVRNLPAGDYTVVTIRADGTVASSRTVTVQSGRTSRVM